MPEKKLPTKLIVVRKKDKETYLSFPGNKRQVLTPGVNTITDENVITHLYDEKINQGWLSCIEKGVHEVTEVF